ncbi:hypothetical protein [Enterococcus phage vB_Efs22_KEN09]|nr:MAG TPA: hypothetical protein [Caudoviricetes sp.]
MFISDKLQLPLSNSCLYKSSKFSNCSVNDVFSNSFNSSAPRLFFLRHCFPLHLRKYLQS